MMFHIGDMTSHRGLDKRSKHKLIDFTLPVNDIVKEITKHMTSSGSAQITTIYLFGYRDELIAELKKSYIVVTDEILNSIIITAK